jgi:hypothetical protein
MSASAVPLDPTEAEEQRLRQQIQHNPPGKPAYGIFLLGQNDEPVGKTPTSSLWYYAANPSLAPAEPMRIWDPRGIIDYIDRSKSNQQAAARKADKIHEKLRQKLGAIGKQDNSVTDDIKALITELHDDFQQLNRMVNAIDYHWRHIEDGIACAYGYESEEDALEMLGIIYSDEEKAWLE